MANATKNCPACGEEILAVAKKCRHCETYFDDVGRPISQGPDIFERSILPVGRPASAIAAGYLAFFAILPLIGLIPAILAVVFGIMAIKKINRDPSLHGKGRAWFGIILGGLGCIMNLIGVIIIVIAAIMESR